jgi:hypothetical protein
LINATVEEIETGRGQAAEPMVKDADKGTKNGIRHGGMEG